MTRVALLIAVAFGPMCWGAETKPEAEDKRSPRERLWDASLEVMKRHFYVKHAEKTSGRIVADSRISNTTGKKTRGRVEAKLIKDDEGDDDVEVRVTNQIDLSEPSALRRRQSRYRWSAVTFDEEAETRLVNEIKDLVYGKPKAFKSNHFPFASPQGKKYPASRVVIPAKKPKTKRSPTHYRPSTKARHLLLVLSPKRQPSEDVVLLIVRGENEFRDARYGDSANTFRKALMADPHPAVKFALGHALFAKGDYGFAAAALREGVQAAPESTVRRIEPRELYGTPGDFDAQRKRLATWLAEHPDDTQAKFLMAYVCYFGGDAAQARGLLADLLANAPDDAAAKALLAGLSTPRTTTTDVQ